MNTLINKVLIYVSNSNTETLKIVSVCIKNSIAIEILNGNELYFMIYDTNYFDLLSNLLGSDVINEEGFNI
jgi:hypothetical protein